MDTALATFLADLSESLRPSNVQAFINRYGSDVKIDQRAAVKVNVTENVFKYIILSSERQSLIVGKYYKAQKYML